MRFLTTAELQAHVATRVYRPGWTFEVYRGQWEYDHIVIDGTVEDAFNPGQTQPLNVHVMIPPMPSTEYFDVWLQWRLARVEIHESREFFRDAGTMKPIFDPHAENAQRDNDDYVLPTERETETALTEDPWGVCIHCLHKISISRTWSPKGSTWVHESGPVRGFPACADDRHCAEPATPVSGVLVEASPHQPTPVPSISQAMGHPGGHYG